MFYLFPLAQGHTLGPESLNCMPPLQEPISDTLEFPMEELNMME